MQAALFLNLLILGIPTGERASGCSALLLNRPPRNCDSEYNPLAQRYSKSYENMTEKWKVFNLNYSKLCLMVRWGVTLCDATMNHQHRWCHHSLHRIDFVTSYFDYYYLPLFSYRQKLPIPNTWSLLYQKIFDSQLD